MQTLFLDGLGREPYMRIMSMKDDGSYTVRIKSLDGLHEAVFCVVKAQHEWNWQFARSPDGSDAHHLKA